MKPTHKISACYFSKIGEIELTWEDLETGEVATLTTKVDEATGKQISKIVPSCIYLNAIIKNAKPVGDGG